MSVATRIRKKRQAPQRDRNLSTLDAVSKLSQVLVLVTGIFYVVGFIAWCTHAYLNGLGMLPVVNPQYVVTGLAPFMVGLSAFLFFSWLLKVRSRTEAALRGGALSREQIQKRLTTCCVFAVVVSAGTIYLFYLALNQRGALVSTFLLAIAAVTVFTLAIAFAGALAPRPEVAAFKVQHKRHMLFWRQAQVLGSGALALLTTTPLFIQGASWLPQEFGGARPRRAYIDVKVTDLSPETKRRILPADVFESEGPARTRLVEVLFVSERTLLIRPAGTAPTGEHVIELPKEKISAIRFIKS